MMLILCLPVWATGVIVSVKELEASPADQSFRELQVILSINRKAAFGLILTVIVISHCNVRHGI